MNKKMLFYTYILFCMEILATSITFINDTEKTIYVSDHRTKIIIIQPQGKQIITQPAPCNLFFYIQTTPQECTFFGNLKEAQTSMHPMTIKCSEIFSEEIVSLFPGLFTLTTKQHAFEKKKTELPAVQGSALSTQTVQSILQALDTLPNRQQPTDSLATNPLAALLAARHAQTAVKKSSITKPIEKKKSVTHSSKK